MRLAVLTNTHDHCQGFSFAVPPPERFPHHTSRMPAAGSERTMATPLPLPEAVVPAVSLSSRIARGVGSIWTTLSGHKRPAADRDDIAEGGPQRQVRARVSASPKAENGTFGSVPDDSVTNPLLSLPLWDPVVPPGFCGICLDTVLMPTSKVGSLPTCGHCFHVHCYAKWKAFCPSAVAFWRCPLCDQDASDFYKLQLFPQLEQADDDNNNNHEQSQDQVSRLPTPLERDEFHDAVSGVTLSGTLRKLVNHVSSSTDPHVVTRALDELSTLAFRYNHARVPICVAGGIAGIVRVLTTWSHDTKTTTTAALRHACQLLGNLPLNESATERIEIAICNAGGMDAILSIMQQHPNDVDLQEQAVFSLGKFICEDELLETNYVADQIPAIFRTMQRHSDAALVQTYGCYALASLTFREDVQEVVQMITAQHGIPIVLQALTQHVEDPDVVDAALNLLANLTEHDTSQTRGILESKSLKVLGRAMQNFTELVDVQMHGIVILQRILRLPDRISEAALMELGQAGVVVALTKSIDLYADKVDLQIGAIIILARLAPLVDLQPIMRDAGTPGVLRVTMDIYNDEETLMTHAYQVLSCCSESPVPAVAAAAAVDVEA